MRPVDPALAPRPALGAERRSRAWELRCVGLGRPLTSNTLRRMNHHQWGPLNRRWRSEFARLAKDTKIPHLDEVHVTAMALLPNRRAVPDVDAIHPTVKAAVDGLVDAGVLADDGPDHVAAITYVRPEITGTSGLLLRVREVLRP